MASLPNTDIVSIPEDPKNSKELFIRLFSYLKEIPVGEFRIYFSGEFDSNQSDFETLSNHLDIGTIAGEKKVGLILLVLLRIIIDGKEMLDILFPDIDSIKEAVEEEEWPTGVAQDGSEMSFQWWVDSLARHESAYMVDFSLNERYTRTLRGFNGKTDIDKTLDDVDAWTLTRIEKAIMKLFE